MADDKLSRTVLYNENLTPPDNVTTVPDSPGGYLSGQTLVDQDNGWKWAPAPTEPQSGLAPEPVTYAPVEPEPPAEVDTKPKSKPRAADADKPKEGD